MFHFKAYLSLELTLFLKGNYRLPIDRYRISKRHAS